MSDVTLWPLTYWHCIEPMQRCRMQSMHSGSFKLVVIKRIVFQFSCFDKHVGIRIRVSYLSTTLPFTKVTTECSPSTGIAEVKATRGRGT